MKTTFWHGAVIAVLTAMSLSALAETGTPTTAAVITGLTTGTSGERITGSGRVIEDVRDVGSFSAVRISGSMNVTLKASDRERVTVRFDDNLQPLVITRIIAGSTSVLEITTPDGSSFRSAGKPAVIVEFKTISELALRGSGEVRADRLYGPVLAASISGSSDMRVDSLEVDVLGVAIAGSGNFTAAGRADEQGFSISGSGSVKTPDLQGRIVKVRIAGSGDARVNAEEMLEATIAGSGDVFYRGNPAVKKRIAGSGELHRVK